jgi:hypothetical protein
VAQPFDRKATVPAMGPVDEEAGQFWVNNPWQIVAHEKNLSAYERNRGFLNLGGGRFADISFLTGTDSDGDGRSAFGADLNGDGMEDLIVRQAGGGPLLIYLNQFPRRHFLRITLRGRQSNAQGIGARVTAIVGDQRIVREMYPVNTYASQQPCEVHLGLGDATRVDRLTIRWPSGLVQELSSIAADQRLRITEGEGPQVLAARPAADAAAP